MGLLRPGVDVAGSHESTGLGLPMCLRAVKAIGGELRVHDAPGRGCVFTIELPKQSPDPTPIRARRPQPAAVPLGAQRARAR